MNDTIQVSQLQAGHSIKCKLSHSICDQLDVCTLWPCDLDLLTYLILNGYREDTWWIVPVASLVIVVLAVLVLRKDTQSQTHRQKPSLLSNAIACVACVASTCVRCVRKRQLIGMLGRSSGNHDWLLANASACVSCGFRLRNAGNASDCVWMETGLEW